MYLKHTLDLGEIIARDPETANDTITWTSTNPKIATVSATGVVTAKKVNWDGESYTKTKGKDDVCKIIAVGERHGKVEREIKVEKGTAATGVAVFVRTNTGYDSLKTYTQDLATSRENKDFLIQTYAKVSVAVGSDGKTLHGNPNVISVDAVDKTKKPKSETLMGGEWYITKEGDSYVKRQLIITDTVTLSSNKKAVATANLTHWNEWGSGDAEVVHSGVGKAAITVKTTSGKSAKFTVNVKASLTGLEIEGVDDDDTLYSGQSVTLTAVRTPVESKDAVKWSIVPPTGKKSNPNAKINNKGVLTISNKLDPTVGTVTIHLESSKAINGSKVKATDVTINVAQSSIDSITVTETGNAAPVSKIWFEGTKKKTSTSTQNISVPLNKTYEARVTAGYGVADTLADTLEDTLQWSASGKNIVEITGSGANVKITAKSAGTATITVSGVRAVEGTGKNTGKIKSASVIKTTFKVKVKQPVQSVTLNKPSVVLAYQSQTKKGVTTTKSQKVSLKATLGPKGVDKKEAITWSVLKNKKAPDDGTAVPTTGKGSNKKPVTGTSATFTLVAPEIGDEYTITAKTASGASATSTIKIVKKTQGVQIAKSSTLVNNVPDAFVEGEGKKAKKNTKNVDIGDSFQMFTFVNVGNDTKAANAKWELAGDSGDGFVAEDVAYSVNKKGIVSVDKAGNVFAIKKGTVTITAKTPMGKKATLKVTVK